MVTRILFVAWRRGDKNDGTDGTESEMSDYQDYGLNQVGLDDITKRVDPDDDAGPC